MEGILAEWGNHEEIDYIVVTVCFPGLILSISTDTSQDGEEILGIGDQGVGGIGISTAKLVLMTLCGGLHPNRTLPVVLDCGTDNLDLLEDDLYLGLRRPRVRGKQYGKPLCSSFSITHLTLPEDDFVDVFIKAVKKLFPKAMLHFEDFGLTNARKILENYRDELPCLYVILAST